MDKGKILELLKAHQEEIKKKFSVKKVGLFGSHVRGDTKQESDIDILVELGEPTFDNYMELKFYLEDLFQAEVDLVMADALKPRLREYIEQAIIYA